MEALNMLSSSFTPRIRDIVIQIGRRLVCAVKWKTRIVCETAALAASGRIKRRRHTEVPAAAQCTRIIAVIGPEYLAGDDRIRAKSTNPGATDPKVFQKIVAGWRD
jgi:hypothetical protein